MSSLHALNPRADLLRREQAFQANLVAAVGLQEILTTNLGPKGTQKMLVSGGGQIKVTKDGNVLLKEMHIQHPTAAIIARAATAQDIVVGDGSTTDILLIGEIMKLSERLLIEGVHPRKITEGLELGKIEVLKFLNKFKRKFPNPQTDRELLLQVARTSLNTKLESSLIDQLSNIIVDAILCLLGPQGGALGGPQGGPQGGASGVPQAIPQAIPSGDPLGDPLGDSKGIPLDLFMVEILHMKSGLKSETSFIRGMVMDHGCRHEGMPHSLENCYTLTCNVSLEYEKTEVNSGFFYSSSEQRNRLAEAERRYTDSKVYKIIELKKKVCTNSNNKNFVIFNQKGIDPPALEILARENIMALRRVKRRNMERLTLCCGGEPVNSVEDLKPEDLGFAEHVWETNIGDEKYTFVEGVKDPRSCCILIRSPNDHSIEQIKDAIRDGLRSIKNLIIDQSLVPGAGSFELACHQHLIEYSKNFKDKSNLGIKLLAKSLLAIPKALIKNSGFDTQDTLLLAQNQLTAAGAEGEGEGAAGEGAEGAAKVNRGSTPGSAPTPTPRLIPDVGIDVLTGQTNIPSAMGIWDNYSVKEQSIVLSTTLASQLLLVDEVIKAGKQMGNKQ